MSQKTSLEAGRDETIVQRLRRNAYANPAATAVSTPDDHLTRAQLDITSDQVAAHLVAEGVGVGSRVAIVLPNCVEFAVAVVAVWKAGATPIPLNSRLTKGELDALLALAQPRIVLSDPQNVRAVIAKSSVGATQPVDGLSVSSPWKILGSGGSTGRPKLIVAESAATVEGAGFEMEHPMRMRDGEPSVITGPLSHNGPFLALVAAFITGAPAILTGKFDPETTLRTIDESRAGWVYLVPTMMSRILKLPSSVRSSFDVSTLRTVMHMGAACPEWVKRAWIDWVGADAVTEVYTSTESIAVFVCGGQDWLERPGTVGRPIAGEIQIRSKSGDVLGPHETGLIWGRRADHAVQYSYIGGTPEPDKDGWETLGDVGHVDEDGFLYIEEREADMILVAGSNVYPAEIEAVIALHPAVDDVCVVGLPDDDRGQVPHAIISSASPFDQAELVELVQERLAPYKHPLSYEFTRKPLRDAAGKVRRRRLVDERVSKSGHTA